MLLALVVTKINVSLAHLAITFSREILVDNHVQQIYHIKIKLQINVIPNVLILDLSMYSLTPIIVSQNVLPIIMEDFAKLNAQIKHWLMEMNVESVIKIAQFVLEI